jgi:Domain of unknown function (DUF3943)
MIISPLFISAMTLMASVAPSAAVSVERAGKDGAVGTAVSGGSRLDEVLVRAAAGWPGPPDLKSAVKQVHSCSTTDFAGGVGPALVACGFGRDGAAGVPDSGERVGKDDAAGGRTAEGAPRADEGDPVWGVPLAHGAAVMVGMRVSLYALWPRFFPLWPTAEMGRNIERAYTLPPRYDRHRRLLESDGDPLLLNTVGHGAFGSEVYQRARACRHGPVQSFVFTAFTSTVWEYSIEAPNQRPSAVDLVWTPLVGAAFGEFRFQMWRLARGDPSRSPSPARRALMILVDPFGEAQRALGTGC